MVSTGNQFALRLVGGNVAHLLEHGDEVLALPNGAAEHPVTATVLDARHIPKDRLSKHRASWLELT